MNKTILRLFGRGSSFEELIHAAKGHGKRLSQRGGNFRKPHQSAREKMRRVRQGQHYKNYIHGAQYKKLWAGIDWGTDDVTVTGRIGVKADRERRVREEYLGQFD